MQNLVPYPRNAYSYLDREPEQQLLSLLSNAIVSLIEFNFTKTLTCISQSKILLNRMQKNIVSKRLELSLLNIATWYHIKKKNSQQALKSILNAIKLQQTIESKSPVLICRTLLSKLLLLVQTEKHQESIRLSKNIISLLQNYFTATHFVEDFSKASQKDLIFLQYKYIFQSLEKSYVNKQLLKQFKVAYETIVEILGQGHWITKSLFKVLSKNSKSNHKRQVTENNNEIFALRKSPLGKFNQNRYDPERKYKIKVSNSQKKNQRQKNSIEEASNTVKKSPLKNSKFSKKNIIKIADEVQQQLQKIKRIYQPLKSIHKISYIYEPDLFEDQNNHRLQFLMLPINRSICVNQHNKSEHPILSKQKQIKSDLLEIKPKMIKQIKRKDRFSIKTKRTTQTPTLVTIESNQNIQEHPRINSMMNHCHSKELQESSCTLI